MVYNSRRSRTRKLKSRRSRTRKLKSRRSRSRKLKSRRSRTRKLKSRRSRTRKLKSRISISKHAKKDGAKYEVNNVDITASLVKLNTFLKTHSGPYVVYNSSNNKPLMTSFIPSIIMGNILSLPKSERENPMTISTDYTLDDLLRAYDATGGITSFYYHEDFVLFGKLLADLLKSYLENFPLLIKVEEIKAKRHNENPKINAYIEGDKTPLIFSINTIGCYIEYSDKVSTVCNDTDCIDTVITEIYFIAQNTV